MSSYLRILRERFYQNGKKTVTIEILSELAPLGISVWFCDDGYYHYPCNNSELATQGFGLKGNILIQRWFKDKFDIECKIIKVDGGKNYALRFNVENTRKLICLLKPYVIPSMSYKVGLDEIRRKSQKSKRKIYRHQHYLENKDKVSEYSKQYYIDNRERILQRTNEYKKKIRNVKKVPQ